MNICSERVGWGGGGGVGGMALWNNIMFFEINIKLFLERTRCKIVYNHNAWKRRKIKSNKFSYFIRCKKQDIVFNYNAWKRGKIKSNKFSYFIRYKKQDIVGKVLPCHCYSPFFCILNSRNSKRPNISNLYQQSFNND